MRHKGVPSRLKLGKLPPDVLEKYLLGMKGAPSLDLIIPPSLGVDFGVVKNGGAQLVISSDPVTGVKENVGWYAVNVSANDIATSGNRPQFIQSVILLPERSTSEDVAKIAAEIDGAAASLGIAIVGGHTELTPGLQRPIVITTAFAFSASFVTAADAKEGDSILVTKTAGVEGTAICAEGQDVSSLPKGISLALVRKAKAYFRKLSVVDEAAAAYATGSVHAMHDCTEGGVIGAVFEMSKASGLGFQLEEERIPVAPETAALCKALRIDPLRLISSGTLLLSVQAGEEKKVIDAIEKAGSRATVVGRFTKGSRDLVHPEGSVERLVDAPTDELWKLIEKHGMKFPL